MISRNGAREGPVYAQRERAGIRVGIAGLVVGCVVAVLSVGSAVSRADRPDRPGQTTDGTRGPFGNTVSANATVKLVAPVECIKTNDLRFGCFALIDPNQPGKVYFEKQGTVYARKGENVSLLPWCSPDVGVATFRATGDPGRVFCVTIPPNCIQLTGPGDPMEVCEFKMFPPGVPPGCLTLDGAGNAAFDVSGTLKPNPGQAPGDYSGNFEVTCQYQ